MSKIKNLFLIIVPVFFSTHAMEVNHSYPESFNQKLIEYRQGVKVINSHCFLADSINNMSELEKEILFIKNIYKGTISSLHTVSSQLPDFKFSLCGQFLALFTLIDNYHNKVRNDKTAPEGLQILLRHGITLNIKIFHDLHILHFAVYKAAQLGKVDLLEAFFKCGATLYDSNAWNELYQNLFDNCHEKHVLKILTSFMRKFGIQILCSLTKDENFLHLMGELDTLDRISLQDEFIDVLKNYLTLDSSYLAFRVLAFKSFFEKEKLSPLAQKFVLELILRGTYHADIGCFFLMVAIKYGLDLNLKRNQENITGLEYIVKDAFDTGRTRFFAEALKNGVEIYDSFSNILSFLDFKKMKNSVGNKLFVILTNHINQEKNLKDSYFFNEITVYR